MRDIPILSYTDRKDETVGDGKEQDWKSGTERDRLYYFDNYGYRAGRSAIDSTTLITMAVENVPTADSCTRDETLNNWHGPLTTKPFYP